MATLNIRLKSVLVPPTLQDGNRYLVETLWPEGLDTYTLWPFEWLKEVAPSHELRQKADWERWDSSRFRTEYWKELSQPERRGWMKKLKAKAQEGTVTLLYSSRSSADSSAVMLQEYLLSQDGSSK